VKGQSRLGSLAETTINIGVGFIIAFIVNAIILPAYGHPVSIVDNLQITGVFTVISIIRGYVMRRIFNHLQVRGSNGPKAN